MKILKKICLALALCCALGWSCAAGAYDGALEDVRVTGTAVREVNPDLALLDFTVTGQGDDAGEASADAARKTAAARRALLSCNILNDALENIGYYLYPVYNEKGKVSGYKADISLRVQINDINKSGTVIDRLSAAGADSLGNLRFTVKNKELLQRQLAGEAVQNAKEQAAVLAGAGGRRLGRLLSVSMNSGGGNSPLYRNMAMTKSADGATVIETGAVKITASVDAVFALE